MYVLLQHSGMAVHTLRSCCSDESGGAAAFSQCRIDHVWEVGFAPRVILDPGISPHRQHACKKYTGKIFSPISIESINSDHSKGPAITGPTLSKVNFVYTCVKHCQEWYMCRQPYVEIWKASDSISSRAHPRVCIPIGAYNEATGR